MLFTFYCAPIAQWSDRVQCQPHHGTAPPFCQTLFNVRGIDYKILWNTMMTTKWNNLANPTTNKNDRLKDYKRSA